MHAAFPMTDKESADEQQSVTTPSREYKKNNCHMKAGNHKCHKPYVCHLLGAATANSANSAIAAIATVAAIAARVWPNLTLNDHVVLVFVCRQYAVHLPTNKT